MEAILQREVGFVVDMGALAACTLCLLVDQDLGNVKVDSLMVDCRISDSHAPQSVVFFLGLI
jgi:hypothetical protein